MVERLYNKPEEKPKPPVIVLTTQTKGKVMEEIRGKAADGKLGKKTHGS